MTQIEEQGSHEGFSGRNDRSGDTRHSRPSAAASEAVSGTARNISHSARRQAKPPRARAIMLQEIGFEVGGEPLAELARVGAQQQPVCRA